MVADYLHCHLSTVYRLVKDGRIPHFQLGGNFRFHRSAIDEWIEKGGISAGGIVVADDVEAKGCISAGGIEAPIVFVKAGAKLHHSPE